MVVAREQYATAGEPGLATWERSLAALLPHSPEPAGATPLALQFEVKQPAPSRLGSAQAVDPRLLIRPVLWGKSEKWVRTGISWSELRFGEVRLRGCDPEHVALMHEFAQLDSSGYSYAASPAIDLGLVRRTFWGLLDRAADIGMALVFSGRTSQRVEVPTQPATVSLDLARADAAADLALRVRIDVGGEPVPLADVSFLGRPAHGYFNEPGSAGTALRLVRLERPLSNQLDRFIASGGALDIPATDAQRFLAGYWPKLRETVRVTSIDGSVRLPVVTGPRLRACVAFAGHEAVTLSWGYTIRC
jgi:hypothetical protein